MQNSQGDQNTSEAMLSLELDASLYWMADPDASIYEGVHRALVTGLTEIMETLGIPGTAVVKVTAVKESPIYRGQFLRIYVKGQLCRYSDELLRYVHSYVNGSHLDPRATPGNIMAWLNSLYSKEDLAREKVTEFFSLACLEIIKSQPSVLLGLDQVADYIATLPDSGSEDELSQQSGAWPPDPDWLLPILNAVLDLKISIADRKSVAKVLGKAQGQSQEDIIEDLITALRPDVIEIQLPPDYLRQITTFDQEEGTGFFTFLRLGLFGELGMRYPSFRFVLVEKLSPNSFAIKINHLTMLPMIGLRSDQCLVNDIVERLRLIDIQGIATSNPANDMEGSLIDSSLQDVALKAGLTKWNQLEYLILTFAAILRANSKCFLYRQSVQDQLDQLRWIFSALMSAVNSNVSVTQITRTLRALVAEQISIKNLKLILEGLLEYSYTLAETYRGGITYNTPTTTEQPSGAHFNDSLDLLSFVRSSIRYQIGQKYARGTGTVVVYLLDPKIEELLFEHQSLEAGEMWRIELDDHELDKILDAIRAELAYLPPTAMRPAILTTADVRASLRKIIALELPSVFVISYSDIPSNMNVQPVARISLNT
ncbi:MAG: hypothetical protein NVSMB27_36010 [Ktedonobacteraceae bacterium]